MHDMLPRKPATAIPEIKNGFKDLYFGNNMNCSTSPALISHGGESMSRVQDRNTDCDSSMLPTELASSVSMVTTAASLDINSLEAARRMQVSPQHNFDTNGKNNTANQNDAFRLQQRQEVVSEIDEIQTLLRNSVSDELDSSSLTQAVNEGTISDPLQRDLDMDLFFEDMDRKMSNKVLNGPTEKLFSDVEDDLPEFGADVSSPILFQNNSLRTLSKTEDKQPFAGVILNNLEDFSPSTVVVISEASSSQGFQTSPMLSSSSSVHFQNHSVTTAPDLAQKKGNSRLQDILGVTDTIRLKSMSRSIDSVPFKSSVTTTSSSTGMRSLPTLPCTMAPPCRVSNTPSQLQFTCSSQDSTSQSNVQGFMDNGPLNDRWNRESLGLHKDMTSPSGPNPMSCLQYTVDSIPAAPHGPSEPGTPVMGPPSCSPLSVDEVLSPSITSGKRCVSADPVVAVCVGKKVGDKRERARSVDSREDEKKEASGAKNKRLKNCSKEKIRQGKKCAESKRSGRITSLKEEKFLQHDSALSGLLDVQTNNPYSYIFNTDVANEAAENVNSNKVPDIILFHQSFLGNCRLQPSEHFKADVTVAAKTPVSSPAMFVQSSMSMPTASDTPNRTHGEKLQFDAEKPSDTEMSVKSHESFQASNSQKLKLSVSSSCASDAGNVLSPFSNFISTPTMSTVTSQSANQEWEAERRLNRKGKLDFLRKMKADFSMRETQGVPGNSMNDNVRCLPTWSSQADLNQYSQVGCEMHRGIRPEMKQTVMRPELSMFPDSKWHDLVEAHDEENRRCQRVTGAICSHPLSSHIEYPSSPRMPMNQPLLRRMNSGHRPMMRAPLDPIRIPGGCISQRMEISHGHYPHLPPPNQRFRLRMPVYEQYNSPQSIRHPTRLPHTVIRSIAHENYPFSEQLMKQANFYNTNGESCMGMEHHPQVPASPPSQLYHQGMIETNHRMPLYWGRDGMEPNAPDACQSQPYNILPPMASPSGSLETRMQGPTAPTGVVAMMGAIARREECRLPDSCLNSHLPPRSPMNCHGQGVIPFSNLALLNPHTKIPYNSGEIGHLPQALTMPGCAHSPPMGQLMRSASAGLEASLMMGRAGLSSLRSVNSPPGQDLMRWTGSNASIPVKDVANSPLPRYNLPAGRLPGVARMPRPNHLFTCDTRLGRSQIVQTLVNDDFQQGCTRRLPTPMPTSAMPEVNSGIMMNMGRILQPGGLEQQRENFSEIPEFDLRNILPSESPSQTISYLPPKTNSDQISSFGWGPDRIKLE